MAMDMITTLHQFISRWLTDAGFREQYDGDVEAALDANGFDDVDPSDLMESLPLIAEDLPLDYQRAVYSYMNTVNNVDSGSNFNVAQGGSAAAQADGGQAGAAAVAVNAQTEPYPGEDPADAVARHITNIQNVYETNITNIDDSGDITNTITAGDDVNFDQNIADDGGVLAGGDVSGVNTGENSGIVAGDDVEDSPVTNIGGDVDDSVVGSNVDDSVIGDDNVTTTVDDLVDSNLVIGDDNTTTGDITGDDNQVVSGDDNIVTGEASNVAVGDNNIQDVEDSNVVTGDDNITDVEDSNVIGGDFEGGVFVGDDVSDSSLIGGDNFGQSVGDGEDANIIGGDSGVAAAGGSTIGDVGNVNVGDGQQFNVDADDSAVNFGSGDSTVDQSTNDSFNTDNSTNDSFNTENKDSFNTENEDSFNTDNSVENEDSFNTDNSVEIEESFNADQSFNEDVDDASLNEAEVDDSPDADVVFDA